MILILAYGNSLRRDDGAGFALAKTLEDLLAGAGVSAERLESHQLTPELALDISKEDVSAVVFVDTRAVSNRTADLSLHAERVLPADIASPSVGHSLDPSVLLAYTKYLFKKNPPAWLLTIPGIDFEHGEGFSEAVEKLLDEAPGRLRKFVDTVAQESAIAR